LGDDDFSAGHFKAKIFKKRLIEIEPQSTAVAGINGLELAGINGLEPAVSFINIAGERDGKGTASGDELINLSRIR